MTVCFFFLFLSDEWPTLETLDFTIPIGSTPFYISICISTLPIRSTLRLFNYNINGSYIPVGIKLQF